MSLDVRERLIALLYASLCQRDMEGHVRETLSSAAARLLKKSLPNGLTLKLCLPWRPLYDLLQPLFVPRYKDRMGLGEGRKLLSLIRLVPLVRNYFSPESSKEILEETLPYINPHHLTDSVARLSILSLFLPTLKREDVMDLDDVSNTPWLPALFKVWSLFL